MKRIWKQVLAGIMTAVMLLGLLPTAAYASIGQLIANGAVQNAALLETLRQMYGEDAEAYLAVLEQYGLVDEDGNLITDEKIVVDGAAYTLAELETYLATPGLDLSRIATVDGQPISLEDLKTLLEIEQYLAELKARYFTPQDLNDEQIDSFYDLAGAIANGEVMMLSANVLTGAGPAGVDHGVSLSVTAGDRATINGTYTVTVTATGSSAAPNQPISFSWRAVSGSVLADGSGSITMRPGESKTLTINVGAADGYVDGSATFLVQLYGLKNALFTDGSTRWEKTVTLLPKKAIRAFGIPIHIHGRSCGRRKILLRTW